MAKGKGYTVTLNAKALVQKHQRAFAAANVDLEQAIIGEIASPIWNWPGTTVRQSGEVAGSPRNIIDSGDLLDSYRVEKRGPNAYSHGFAVPYALAVHNGAVLRNGGVIVARPFTERPAQALPQMFVKRYRQG